jgi:multiple sugar transport system substrate-binding protein
MKKALRLAIGFTAIAGLLAGCSNAPSGQSDAGGVVHLTFRQFDDASQVEGLVTAVKAWNQKHPKIQVKMQTLATADAAKQFAREANSGSGPDVQQIANANIKDLANPKILLPLDKLIKKDPLDQPFSDFLATDLAKIDGTTWAVPWTVDTFALTYRPDVLKEAGIDKPPTTWDELFTDAKKLTGDTPDGKKRTGFCFSASSSPAAGQWFAINYYLWSHNQNLVEKKSGNWEPGASVKQMASAIDYFNEYFTSGASSKSMIAIDSFTDPQITTAVADGTCGMTYEPPQTFRTMEATAGDNKLMSAPMPDGLKDGTTHLGGRALGINRSTKHPDEAWQFLKYLTSPATFKTYEQYPASKSVLKNLDVPESEKGFQEQLPHSVSFGTYIASPMPVASMQQLINQQFGAVYSGQSDSTAAAQAIIDGLKQGLQG